MVTDQQLLTLLLVSTALASCWRQSGQDIVSIKLNVSV